METEILMPRYAIAWPRKCLTSSHRRLHEEREVWMLEAQLLERRLVGGRPRLQLVCRLASIDETEAHADGATR
jgi:hypothetical protein